MRYFYYQKLYVCVETKPTFVYVLYEDGWEQIHPDEIYDKNSMSEIDEDEFKRKLDTCKLFGFEVRRVDSEIRGSLKSLINQHREIIISQARDLTIESLIFWGGWIGGIFFIMSLINYSATVADIGKYGVVFGLAIAAFAIFNHHYSFSERNYQKRFLPIKNKLLEYGFDGHIINDRIFRPTLDDGIDVFDDSHFL